MKKLFTFLIVAIAMITVLVQPSKGQTAYVSLDTLQSGDTIRYCLSEYNQVTLYAPTVATTSLNWFGDKPIAWNISASSISLNPTNSGEIWFMSDQTPTIHLYFYLVGSPISSVLADIAACGDIFSYPLDAGNADMGASYLWSTGATTQIINAQVEGTYSVIVDNGCGIAYDTVVITGDHSNDANLGANQTVCMGNPITLVSGNINITTYAWSTGETTETIVVDSTGTYSITTTDNSGCVSVDTIQITVLSPPSQNIELVTIDTNDGNNRITWENLYGEADVMKIYRELTTNNYVLVGTAPYNDLTWTDTVSSRNQSWRYKIAIMDTCGNEGTKSTYVQSIHTWVTPVVGGGYNIQWTPYEIETKGAVSQYNIYYGDQLSSLNYLTFVSGSVTTYTLSDFTDSVYVIGAQLSGKGVADDALSNWIAETDAVGIADIDLTDQISITPTLTDGPVTITTDLTIKEVKIYTVLGQELLPIGQTSLTTRDKHLILPHGLYMISIVTEKGTMTTKIIVQ